MNVKAVVKVMNFHALLRVDASRKQAEKLMAMESALTGMMQTILNNRNLQLDKRISLPDKRKPILKIYLGSDMGFCGGVNAGVSSVMAESTNTTKIAVGKKIRKHDTAELFLTQEEYMKDQSKIKEYFIKAVTKRLWSQIVIVYNQYCNASTIKLTEQKIYPLDIPEDKTIGTQDDFVVEGDITEILANLQVAYLMNALQIATASAFAAENVMRQNATTESLKKLDEMEEEQARVLRKEKNAISFQKTIDSFTKQKALKNNKK